MRVQGWERKPRGWADHLQAVPHHWSPARWTVGTGRSGKDTGPRPGWACVRSVPARDTAGSPRSLQLAGTPEHQAAGSGGEQQQGAEGRPRGVGRAGVAQGAGAACDVLRAQVVVLGVVLAARATALAEDGQDANRSWGRGDSGLGLIPDTRPPGLAPAPSPRSPPSAPVPTLTKTGSPWVSLKTTSSARAGAQPCPHAQGSQTCWARETCQERGSAGMDG